MFKAVFKLAYRQAQGFAQILLKLMWTDDLEFPSYSQICRRAKRLNVIPYQIPGSGQNGLRMTHHSRQVRMGSLGPRASPGSPPKPLRLEYIWYLYEPDDIPNCPRNVAINRIDEVGKKEWKIETGYHRRSLSGKAMFRYRTIHGNKLYSRNLSSQDTESDIKIKSLNMMTAIGMPETVRIIAF